jgi:hypothetical protein
MSAPVLTVPQGGPIAARPRREGLYDTEAFLQAGTVNAFPFFQNTRTFAEVTAGNKTTGLDTNLVGNGGSIPRGHYLRVFGANMYWSYRGAATMAGNGARFDDKRKICESSFWRLLLGSTPYLDTPTPQVPAGTGVFGPLATGEAATSVGDVQFGWPICTCYRDLTVPGKIRKQTPQGVKEIRVPRIPIEFAETESFTVVVSVPGSVAVRAAQVAGTTVFMTCYLVSIYLKPLAG